jgi:hypothetical protein
MANKQKVTDNRDNAKCACLIGLWQGGPECTRCLGTANAHGKH